MRKSNLLKNWVMYTMYNKAMRAQQTMDRFLEKSNSNFAPVSVFVLSICTKTNWFESHCFALWEYIYWPRLSSILTVFLELPVSLYIPAIRWRHISAFFSCIKLILYWTSSGFFFFGYSSLNTSSTTEATLDPHLTWSSVWISGWDYAKVAFISSWASPVLLPPKIIAHLSC